MLQPYKAFCHGFCESLSLLYAKTTPIPRSSSGQALKVKPMLGGRYRAYIHYDSTISGLF